LVLTPVAVYSHPFPLKTGVSPAAGSTTVPVKAPAAVIVPLSSIPEVVLVADANSVRLVPPLVKFTVPASARTVAEGDARQVLVAVVSVPLLTTSRCRRST
jgi:hypothetical protein